MCTHTFACSGNYCIFCVSKLGHVRVFCYTLAAHVRYGSNPSLQIRAGMPYLLASRDYEKEQSCITNMCVRMYVCIHKYAQVCHICWQFVIMRKSRLVSRACVYACMYVYINTRRYDTCADELSSREREKLCNEHTDKLRDDMLSRMQVKLNVCVCVCACKEAMQRAYRQTTR
jgi:hypothetical protein